MYFICISEESDYFLTQYWITCFHNRDWQCLLCGTSSFCTVNGRKDMTMKGHWQQKKNRVPFSKNSITNCCVILECPDFCFLICFRLLWTCIVSKVRRERKNQQDATITCLYQLLSQHVSGIIMPIFRRTKALLLHLVCCSGSAGCGW